MKVEDAHLSKCDFSHGYYRQPEGFERYWVRSSAPSFLISSRCLENNQIRQRPDCGTEVSCQMASPTLACILLEVLLLVLF